MKNKKVLLISVIILAAISIIFVPLFRTSIRSSEQSALTSPNYNSKSIDSIDYNQVEKTIDDKLAVTIAFVYPDTKVGEEFLSFLENSTKDIDNNLQGTLFIYPMVYNNKKIVENYKIANDEVTILRFSNGKLINRLGIKKLPTDKAALISQINGLI